MGNEIRVNMFLTAFNSIVKNTHKNVWIESLNKDYNNLESKHSKEFLNSKEVVK
jgi:hypothetical protein